MTDDRIIDFAAEVTGRACTCCACKTGPALPHRIVDLSDIADAIRVAVEEATTSLRHQRDDAFAVMNMAHGDVVRQAVAEEQEALAVIADRYAADWAWTLYSTPIGMRSDAVVAEAKAAAYTKMAREIRARRKVGDQ